MTPDPRKVIYLHATLAKHGGERSSIVNSGRILIGDITMVKAKAFVPALDFDQSKRFYQHLGFELVSSDDGLAYFRHGYSSFFVQNLYNNNHADNLVMHLLVVDVEAWWQHVQDQGLNSKYDIKVEPPENKPWGIRDFVIIDPNDVLWRIGQNIDAKGKSTS
jgi:catechol 2,3-dioxygenase-like lactoylglutathione lyase family enzyme